MLRPRPRLLALSALLGSACVLPSGGATGLEVTWSLRERNAVDGPAGQRLRTCAGVDVERVAVRLTDADDPERGALFTWPCARGNPSPEARAREAPEIFLDLHDGRYDLAASALAGDDTELAGRADSAEVAVHAVTALDLELARGTSALTLELAGACERLTLALRYADPAADLHPAAEADAEPPSVYRAALVSDRGLRLGGQDQPCAGLGGSHHVPDLDPGRYLLDLTVDGRRCQVPLRVEDSPLDLALDLEKPACGG